MQEVETTMQIHQSAEDYLETILMLTQRMGKVRSIDVVNELGFTKASVSIAMKKLRENGYISVDGEGSLTLLPPSGSTAAIVCWSSSLFSWAWMCRPLPRMPAGQSISSASRPWRRSGLKCPAKNKSAKKQAPLPKKQGSLLCVWRGCQPKLPSPKLTSKAWSTRF